MCRKQPAAGLEARQAAAGLWMLLGQLHLQEQLPVPEADVPGVCAEPDQAVACFQQAALKMHPFGKKKKKMNNLTCFSQPTRLIAYSGICYVLIKLKVYDIVKDPQMTLRWKKIKLFTHQSGSDHHDNMDLLSHKRSHVQAQAAYMSKLFWLKSRCC